MKTRFLDVRNCHALLPSGHGLSLMQRLEECLRGINDQDGPLHGAIDALVRHNEKTRSLSPGSRRFTGSALEIAQVGILSDGMINTRAIERGGQGPAKLHTILVYEDGTTWKTIVPIQFLLKSWGDANDGYQCYIHTISRNLDQIHSIQDWQMRAEADSDDYYYVGITGRNWLARFSEHMGEMRRGSRKRFHEEWRASLGMRDGQYVSALMDINLTYEQAMDLEEAQVDRVADGPNGLNMIPGGFTGLKHLHEHGVIARQNITLEERDRAVEEYLRQNPRKGIPNPFMSELWKDDEYYQRVIEARPKTLSADQVRKIRRMSAEGASIENIAKEVGALNETQVKNVIAGRTYNRVK